MPVEDPNELERIDQEIRINELREEANELAGGEMTTFEAEHSPPWLMEQFWRHVVDYEKAPLTTAFEQLMDKGIDLPEPALLDDQQLSAKLWEVIHALAEMQTFLYSTDHLSDRELYEHLWSETLREVFADMPLDKNAAHSFDILGGCSSEDLEIRLRYYADEEERKHWAESFPEDVIPPHEDPPYDRDSRLPKWEYD